jgi:[acyl-carrier-protein] S-malonyltransferase
MAKRAFTFPGQGSQAVGMGKALADAYPTAREVFEEVDDALGQKLSALMWTGEGNELTLTENAQPALMAVSIAAVRCLEAEAGFDFGKHAAFVAGHSLGEYSALAAARAITLKDSAKLLRTRGQAMQKAVPVGEGAMAALLGLDLEVVEDKVMDESQKAGVCSIANDNAPGQVVISGAKAAVDAAVERAKDAGAKRAMALPVSAPFHCPLMQPAAVAMAEALAQVTIAPPAVPLVANVIADQTSDPDTIRDLLVKQVTGRVRWRESVLWLGKNGVDTLVEAGAGKVLTGMAKRINRDLTNFNVETPDDLEAFAKTL